MLSRPRCECDVYEAGEAARVMSFMDMGEAPRWPTPLPLPPG